MSIDEPVPIGRSRRPDHRDPDRTHPDRPDRVAVAPDIATTAGVASPVVQADEAATTDRRPTSLVGDWPAVVDPRRAVRWTIVLVEEVAMVPWTIREVRRSLVSLPDRLDRLTGALEETMAGLDATLPRLNDTMGQVTDGVGSVEQAVGDLTGELSKTVSALDRLLPELSGFIGTMDVKLAEMNDSVSELGDMARGVLGAIPGVRRSVRRPPG